MRIARSVLLVTITMMAPLMASSGMTRDIELSQHEPVTMASWSAPVELVPGTTEEFTDPTQASPEFNRLTVYIRLTFDRSVSAKLIRSWLRQEATALWQPYGVDIIWSDEEVEAAFHLDVVVARRPVGVEPAINESALGLTTIDQTGRLHGPIRILSDSIESLMGQRHIDPVLQQRQLARALGRVLAHELGHVLLGAPHDSSGLMRASIPPNDLGERSRRPLALSTSAVERLHERIECLSTTGDQSRCAGTGTNQITFGERR